MFRLIHTSLWREDWFVRLSPIAKLLFFYLLTNDYIQPTGFVPLTAAAIAQETGVPELAINDALQSLDSKVIIFPGWGIWVKRFPKWQGRGPKWRQARHDNLAKLPPHIQAAYRSEYPDGLPDRVSDRVSDTPSLTPSLTPSDTLGYQSVTSKQKTVIVVTPPSPPKRETTTTTTAKVTPLGNEDTGFASIAKAYEQEIGMLTPHIGQELKALYEDVPPGMDSEKWAGWIVKALNYAASQNIRKLSYAKATLKGWWTEGWQVDMTRHEKGSAKDGKDREKVGEDSTTRAIAAYQRAKQRGDL